MFFNLLNHGPEAAMGLEEVACGSLTAAEVCGHVGGSGGVEFKRDESSVEPRGDESMTAGFEEGGDFKFGGFVGRDGGRSHEVVRSRGLREMQMVRVGK
jgi:hypothetical protein